MLDQAILSKTLKLKLTRVCHNRFTILNIHINVLSLDLSCGLTAQMGCWMHCCEIRQDHIGVNHVTLTDMNAGGLEC